ncbi:MAG: 5-methyltetrahydropteroyltriglutamate--homocysteine methyltransferase [Hyphomicrobiales bacterium]|jgi:5-methyltetrahydropteroyltriglutamate--homocysteine methyltransferase|nr:5-methyltetrahydropteroyltriglutamate--homocysteine methyltransferase [Hyphomicrobiales bacterium]
MQRSEHRILTTHAGSLPRPAALTRLYARRATGEAVDSQEIEAQARDATRAIVRKQIETGLDVIDDGEQSRESFVLYMRHRLTGLGGTGARPMHADLDAYPEYKSAFQQRVTSPDKVSNRANLPKAVGEVTYANPGLIEAECADFRAALVGQDGRYAEAFLTAPSPGIIASIVQNEHYDTFERYVDALAVALQAEYEAIVRNGFLLQLDCPDLALERHTSYRDRPLAEFIAFVELVVAAINKALSNIPREKVRLHVCWGNYEGPHDHDVALRDILPAILQAKAGAIFLPFANPRHAHEFRVLESIPLAEDQLLIAGVIDTLTNFVEHPEVVADRIERIAGAIGDPSRLLAGTDCGFDTSAGMGRVTEDVVWAKLRALREGAELASRRLFGKKIF